MKIAPLFLLLTLACAPLGHAATFQEILLRYFANARFTNDNLVLTAKSSGVQLISPGESRPLRYGETIAVSTASRIFSERHAAIIVSPLLIDGKTFFVVQETFDARSFGGEPAVTSAAVKLHLGAPVDITSQKELSALFAILPPVAATLPPSDEPR